MRWLPTLVAILVTAFLLIGATPPASADPEEWYQPTADAAAELYVLERGAGPPVLVIHGGFGAEHSYLLDAVNGLEDRYRFVFYDQRGSLRSPANPESITIQTHVEDIETLRKSLGIDRLTILAHSMGTHLALQYLKAYPDHVGVLVLAGAMPMQSGKYLDPAIRPALDRSGEAVRSFFNRPEIAAESAEIDCSPEGCSPRDATRRWRIAFAGANIFHVNRWREVRGGRAFYNPVAAQAAADTFSNDYDFVGAVDAHAFPITVINGDHDFADFGAAWFEPFVQSRPNVHLTILPEAGHNAWVDQPDLFRGAVLAGLAR